MTDNLPQPSQNTVGPVMTVEPGAIVFIDEPTEGWTVDEAYEFLARDNPSVLTGETETEFIESLIAADEPHSGAMVALVPTDADAKRMALDGYEPPKQLHLTLVFLGEGAAWDDAQRQLLINALSSYNWPSGVIDANAFGVANLNPDGVDPCWVLNVDSDEFNDVLSTVLLQLEEMDGELPVIPPQHQPWLPHVTLAYTTEDVRELAIESLGPLTFDRIRIAFAGDVTDIPLDNFIASLEVFHLPGQHNQHTHGRGGASPSEFEAGERLNKGKKLNMKDPEQARLHGTINRWSGGGNDGAGVTYEMQQAVHNPGADTDGAHLMRVVGGAPANAPELHRGMNGTIHSEDLPSEGDVFALGPTSFTRSTKVRDEFARPESSSFGGATQVHMKLAKGSHSLRVDQEITGKFSNEQEHISMGRFKVTGRRERTVNVKANDGKMKSMNLIELDITQVDESIPITHHKGGKKPVIGPGMDI